MGSNSPGQGGFIANHPDAEEINRMLKVGHTPQEVSDWLKGKHNHKRYWASPASLQNYRKNFLDLNKQELAQKRSALMAEGKTRVGNALSATLATTELTEAKQKATEEIMNVLGNFKTVQDEALGIINLIKTTSKDEFGQPKFIVKNYELMERILGRLESVSVNCAKVTKEMVTPEANQTQITITTAEVQKYSEIFKEIVQKLVTKLDPGLLPEFFRDYEEAMNRIGDQPSQSQVQISVGGQANGKINIVTGISQTSPKLPTPEEVAKVVSTMTNENDYIPEEMGTNDIIETKIDA